MSLAIKEAAITFNVTTSGSNHYNGQVAAYIFDHQKQFIKQVPVREGYLTLSDSASSIRRQRILIAPMINDYRITQSYVALKRLCAYEAILTAKSGRLVDNIVIPEIIISYWAF